MKAILTVVALFSLVVFSLGIVRPPWSDLMDGRFGRPDMGEAPRGVAPELPPGFRQQTLQLLEDERFDELTAAFEGAVERAQVDPRREGEAMLFVETFGVGDPAVTPRLDAWVKARPDSFAPYLARANHRHTLAFRARGVKSAKDTSAEQLARMQELITGVTADANAALARRPGLIEAYASLVDVATVSGDASDCWRIGRAALAQVPASRRIRNVMTRCLQPRWGGSWAAIDEVARDAAPHYQANPALASLDGASDWDRGSMLAVQKKDDEARPYYDRAIAAGDDSRFYMDRARLELRAKNNDAALRDVERALEMLPDDPELLVLRAQALRQLGRHADALAVIAVARDIDPTEPYVASFDHTELNDATTAVYERIQRKAEVGDALARLDAAIEHTGPTAQALFWRGRAHIAQGDHKRALADLDAAIAADPRYYQAYVTADWVLAREGDWTGILRRWDRFLALEPDNAEALLERGGTHKHAGNMTSALADVKKSCALGLAKACAIAARY